jgi:hypothetical protein
MAKGVVAKRACEQFSEPYMAGANDTAEGLMTTHYPLTNWTQAWRAVQRCNPALSGVSAGPLPAGQVLLPSFTVLDHRLRSAGGIASGSAKLRGLCECGPAIVVDQETTLLDVASKHYPYEDAEPAAGMLWECNRGAIKRLGSIKLGQELRSFCTGNTSAAFTRAVARLYGKGNGSKGAISVTKGKLHANGGTGSGFAPEIP